MQKPPFSVLQISDIDPVPITDTLVWRPVRRTLGVEAFGINAYTAANAGDEIVEDHDELGNAAGGHEELYVVISGRVAFTVDGQEIDAPAGTLVFIRDPAVRRSGIAAEAGSTVLAIGGEPGKAYEVSAWEFYFAAIPYAKAGEWDKAVEIVAEGLERFPDNPAILYNLACYEAQAGRGDDALAHLKRSVELDPKYGEFAGRDEDLDSIRGEPGFPA
jgi:tetratricopeptide (TPR) repeat protein